jgi:hypothetical protein
MSFTKNSCAMALGFVLLVAFASAQTKPATGFDQLKSLVGEWEGKIQSGASAKLSYQLVSNGSALMERLQPSSEPEMITMYSADGDHLVVTHYCSAGNQPMMQTGPITGPATKFTFSFVRATGMKTPDEGHMVNLTVTMPDHDHLIQEWTFLEKGKAQTEIFTYTRKK